MSGKVIPNMIYEHMVSRHIKNLAPAWIQLARGTETILAVEGAWQHYFKVLPALNSELSESCEALFAMFPITEPFELQQVQLIDGQYTNISAIQYEDSDWILFCDVTEPTLKDQQYQQGSNELLLVKAQLDRALVRYVGQEVAGREASGLLHIDMAGERRVVTVLFVDIRGFTPFNERHDAQVVLQVLNEYMGCMLPPILAENGMIDKIIGDGVMAVFGVLEPERDSAADAFTAAKKIFESIKKLNKKRYNEGLEQLGAGVGIATGEVILGILGSHDRRCFTAIGSQVNFAARLESSARPGEILLDEVSYQRLKKDESFLPISLTLKGLGEAVAYSYRVTVVTVA